MITELGDKTYEQGETITAFGITVTDADNDTLTVTVTGLPSGLSYANGQVSGTVAADATVQAYTVTISADDGVNAAVTATFTITVTEPAPVTVPAVTVADASAAEGDSLTFTVTLDEAVSGGLTVTPSFADGTAAKGIDYSENTTGISFAGTKGEQHTFTVTTTEDEVVEAGETFTVGLAVSGTSETVTASDTATGTITNDDTATVSIGSASNTEGSAISFAVTVDRAVQGGFTVTPSFADGTATKGTDYTENTTALSFSGAASEGQNFLVATTDDSDDEPDETFTVSLSISGTSLAVTAGDTATGTILDDDVAALQSQSNAPPAITAPGDRTYSPSETITAFGITVTDADNDTVTVTVTGLPSGLSYANGQVSGTVAADATAQAHTVTISADDGVNTAVTATFTIRVAPISARPTVSISGPSSVQTGAFTVDIDFSESVTGFVQAEVTVGNGRVTGWAETNGDARVIITPTASGTVTVDVAANVAVDGDNNGNLAATRYSVTAALQGEPTVTITCPSGVQTGAFSVDIDFSESVTGFVQADVTVGNGRVTGWAETNGDTRAIITPAATGTVTIDVPANVATDSDGNGNLAAPQCSVQAKLGTQAAAPTLTRTAFSAPSNPALDVTWTAPDTDGVTITGYKAQYRKKAAAGDTPAGWTAYSGTLGATARSLTLSDLEAGATYEAQVRAVTSENGDGAWSDTGEGTANRPPQLTESSISGSPPKEWGKTGFVTNISQSFSDSDEDTLTYSASFEPAGIIGLTLTPNDSGARMDLDYLNPGTTTLTYGASDAYGGYASRTTEFTVVANPVRSVPENSPAGTAVGDPVAGTPYGEGTLSYTLTGDAATAFTIDSSTGQISVKEGASLDYETTTSYTGQVKWKVHEDGPESVANLTINVTDVAVGAIATPTLSRKEFSAPSNPALDVTWTAPDTDGVTITGYK
ncbi:MAG: Ig-like domain-containing protein, partial [Acidobacteriota bacterium]|nr:Ig-like domain-containing protein [Acidobacteriota bacterium]